MQVEAFKSGLIEAGRRTIAELGLKIVAYLRMISFIRPLAVRCDPSDHERSRPLGAYVVLGATA